MTTAIELLDLRVDYGDFTAVKNLSLSIEKGEIYGLVGPNGAGKTSTLNVLATLLLPTYGSARMAGFDLELKPDEVRARLGYMPDLAPIIGDLKVWEFLDLFAAAHGMAGKEKSIRVDTCLDMVKMNESRNVLCGTLSRGMTQRVVLAKTLLHRPEVLLLDEPASGMDPIARIDLKDALQTVASEGSTIIISSHILSELAEMANSIGIRHKGELREHGPVHEVLSNLEHETSVVQIDLVDRVGECRDWLASRNLSAVTPNTHPNRLQVDLDGGKAAQSELLKDLITANFTIHGYQAKSSSLEDVMRAISTEDDALNGRDDAVYGRDEGD